MCCTHTFQNSHGLRMDLIPCMTHGSDIPPRVPPIKISACLSVVVDHDLIAVCSEGKTLPSETEVTRPTNHLRVVNKANRAKLQGAHVRLDKSIQRANMHLYGTSSSNHL